MEYGINTGDGGLISIGRGDFVTIVGGVLLLEVVDIINCVSIVPMTYPKVGNTVN